MVKASPILISAHKIAIAGLGLIGGSLARRLVNNGRRVVAWNHRDAPYEQARKDGIECVNSLEELAAGKPDVLVICTPLKAMPSVLNELAPHISPATTLTDVGSVKVQVAQAVEKAGLAAYYVGAHPMAGNELSGFNASDSSLFDDALWAITADNRTDYSRFLTVADMITQGCGNIFISTGAATHDEAAAMISHMPHVVSTALINQIMEQPTLNIANALAAGSWRDMTRVALTDPQRTQAMVEENPDNVSALLRKLSTSLNAVADCLDGISQAESTAQAEAEMILSSFFEAANSYRTGRAKAIKSGKISQDCAVSTIDVTDDQWQQQLAQSAARGERVIRLLTTHQMQVICAPALA